ATECRSSLGWSGVFYPRSPQCRPTARRRRFVGFPPLPHVAPAALRGIPSAALRSRSGRAPVATEGLELQLVGSDKAGQGIACVRKQNILDEREAAGSPFDVGQDGADAVRLYHAGGLPNEGKLRAIG